MWRTPAWELGEFAYNRKQSGRLFLRPTSTSFVIPREPITTKFYLFWWFRMVRHDSGTSSLASFVGG